MLLLALMNIEKQAAKQNFWADALLLRGLVSRIGVCLIVFKYNPEAKRWVRFALVSSRMV